MNIPAYYSISQGQIIAAIAIVFLVVLVIVALMFLIYYFVTRAAVRNGIDRSQLAAFIRQVKLTEMQTKYMEQQQSADQTGEHPRQ